MGATSPASMRRFDASPDAETPSYSPWPWVIRLYMSSEVSAVLVFTWQPVACSNGWTQSYAASSLPSSA